MITKSADELRELVTRVLIDAGASNENARLVAEHLVLANLSGVDTHGVWHLKGYVKGIKEEQLLPKEQPAIVQETANSAMVTGNWTFGQVSARYAMQVAIDKAKGQNMAVVGLVQSNHIGRLGHFTEMAADAGMISMVWAGGYGTENAATFPYGGAKALLHTNPISIGCPGSGRPAMSFDFATTALSGVKVENAFNRGQQLPPGCIVDKHGNDTTDPKEFFDGGGYKPFGQHKGWSILMAAEFLGHVFCGSDAYVDEKRVGSIMRRQGVSMIAIKADLFQPMDEYLRCASKMASQTRDIPPAPGFDKVLMPGDPEQNTRAVRSRDGIPIEDDVWQTVVAAAELVGVTV